MLLPFLSFGGSSCAHDRAHIMSSLTCTPAHLPLCVWMHLLTYVKGICKGIRTSICIRPCMHHLLRLHAYSIHTYMHTCMHAYMHAYIHVFRHTYIHTYVHAHTYITYTHTDINTYILYVCRHAYIHTYIHTYVHAHTYATYTHICTNICICICTCVYIYRYIYATRAQLHECVA